MAGFCIVAELPAATLMVANSIEIPHSKRKVSATNEMAKGAKEILASPGEISPGSLAFAPPANLLKTSSAATVLRI